MTIRSRIYGCLLLTLASGCVLRSSRQLEIRGQLLSRATGQAAQCREPVVVVARPIGKTVVASSKTVVIEQSAAGLSPGFLVVPVGQTVRFLNKDDICHSYFSSSGLNSFQLPALLPGEVGECRLHNVGRVQVYCSLHGGRQATIMVVPTSHFSIAGPTGAFLIGNLERGSYLVETWSNGVLGEQVEVTSEAQGGDLVEIEVDYEQVRGSR